MIVVIIISNITYSSQMPSLFVYYAQKNAKGELLYQELFKHLELLEREFFGLEFLAESPDRMVSSIL